MFFASRNIALFPVERLVLLFTLHHRLSEHLPTEVIVRFLLEFETLHVLQVAMQHEAVLAEGQHQAVNLSDLLESADLGVLFSFGMNLNALPGQLAYEEVQQKIT